MPRYSLTKTLILVSIAALQICAKCKTNMAGPLRYHFLQPVNLSAYKQVYHTDDTLRFEFTDTGKMMFDTITHSFIKGDSFTFTVTASIVRLDKVKRPRPTPGDFITSSDGVHF